MNKKAKNSYTFLSVLTTALLLAGCQNTQLGEGYTYNTYLETNPKTWNVHTWETSDESYITSFTEMGFYDCILNDERNGYEFVTEMASAFPVDVTSSLTDLELDTYYSNKGNLGSSGYAWDIALNPDAVWENGDKITADDYIESMKRQLDPEMGNFRADSYYASTLVISNAERYYKQGTASIEPMYAYIKDDGKYTSSNVCVDGNIYINLGRYTPYIASVFGDTDTDMSFYTVLNQRSATASDAVELAAQRITDGVGYYLIHYAEHADTSLWADVETTSQISDDMWNYNINVDDFSDHSVMVRKTKDDSTDLEEYSTDALKKDLRTFVSGIGRNTVFSAEWAWQYPLFTSIYNDFEQPWQGTDENGNPTGVGLVKIDDYTLRLYLDKQISNLNLKFALSSNWLVKVDLYDSLKVYTGIGGKLATSYATNSVSNYMSYGPYKLTKYESGKSITLEKNENWYGYSDGKHVRQFQMTGIKTTIISEHTTAVQSFEKGELDDLTMNKTDMKKYGNSSRKTTTYESYTQKISINSNRSKLASRQTSGVNKTILANDDFRKGLSLALNRNNFASQTTAGSKGFTGLLNDLYLTDVEIGEMYRSTEQGKSVYNQVYGELGGDPYAADYQVTALEESQNGYNYQMGTYYVAKAIKDELASTDATSLKNGDKLEFEFRVYDDQSEGTIDMTTFIRGALSDVLQSAVEKLKAEDPQYADLALSSDIKVQKDENYYDTAHNGGYDMIFSIWGGAAINPYGLMQVYCDATFDSNCEYGFKGNQGNIYLSIDVDGDGNIANSETKSFNDWYTSLNNDYTEQDRENPDFNQEEYDALHAKKLTILAGLEAGILNRFEAIPLVARGSSSLTSFKVENGTSSYISLVGYGGVRFMTFNYTDSEWNEFINSKEYTADLYKN